MFTRRMYVILTLAVWIVPAAAVEAQLPPKQGVAFNFRAEPNDPESAVRFVVALDLKPVSASGQNVAWKASNARFIKLDSEQTVTQEWGDDEPVFETADGLWWITHDDPEAPRIEEFTMPPRLFGTAEAKGDGVAPLDYDMESEVYVPPPEGPPYATTSAMSYLFWQVGNTVPEEEGELEPVEAEASPELPGG